MLSRGNRLDGRRVASPPLPAGGSASENGGEGGGGSPSEEGGGGGGGPPGRQGGTGMPAEWER